MDWWFDCHRNPACLTSKVQGTMGAMTASAGQSVLASKEIVATLKDLHPRANAVLDESLASLQEAHATLKAATSLVRAMQTDLGTLTANANGVLTTANQTLAPLQSALTSIADLTKTLDEQVRAGSPLAAQTVTDLDGAVKDLDKLIADPNIAAALANVAGATKHLDGSAESIDIALRPWREKANMLKTIVSKAFGLLKLTFPLR
jgi:ABC-type transporter Mla subunit MlaD